MAGDFDRWCADAFGQLLGTSLPLDLPAAVTGWPENPPPGWESAWEDSTRALVNRAGVALDERRHAWNAALAGSLDRRATEVNGETLPSVVNHRIQIARQTGFRCDPGEDFWYFKINHGYWEQLYSVFGNQDPSKMRFRPADRYQAAYGDSGFAFVLGSLVTRFARDEGNAITFPGMHFGLSLEAGNHDHETVLQRFPVQDPAVQPIAVGATIGVLGVFDALFGPRSLSFADGSFPKLAAMAGGLRETLASFARHADRILFVVPPHLQGLTLDGVAIPQETLPVPRQTVHQSWAAALRATVGHVLGRLEVDDRVLVITQSAVFAAMLCLFLRAAKETLVPAEKRIFFFDLGQVIDSATPESGGVWISRHRVHDPSLFRIAGAEARESNA